MLGGTKIAPNTTNMDKRLSYRYILPWTTPGRPKKHHWEYEWQRVESSTYSAYPLPDPHKKIVPITRLVTRWIPALKKLVDCFQPAGPLDTRKYFWNKFLLDSNYITNKKNKQRCKKNLNNPTYNENWYKY